METYSGDVGVGDPGESINYGADWGSCKSLLDADHRKGDESDKELHLEVVFCLNSCFVIRRGMIKKYFEEFVSWYEVRCPEPVTCP